VQKTFCVNANIWTFGKYNMWFDCDSVKDFRK